MHIPKDKIQPIRMVLFKSQMFLTAWKHEKSLQGKLEVWI